MLEQLTLEHHGDFHCVCEFWDCECDDDYIRGNDDHKCEKCGTERDDAPNSRLTEVIERYPDLENVPWVIDQASKNFVH
jgi:hypothetical protein